jgi:hypothetical protein
VGGLAKNGSILAADGEHRKANEQTRLHHMARGNRRSRPTSSTMLSDVRLDGTISTGLKADPRSKAAM